jgi:hypothetical protein
MFYAIVDRKDNNRIAEHVSGQLLIFLTREEAESRYQPFSVHSTYDTSTQWEIVPVVVIVPDGYKVTHG